MYHKRSKLASGNIMKRVKKRKENGTYIYNFQKFMKRKHKLIESRYDISKNKIK